MKKLLYLLLVLPLGLIAAACGDDEKVPDVDVQATISGGVVDGNTIYAVQGEPLTIDALSLVNNTGKDGAIGVVNYYIDGVAAGQSVLAPYTFEIYTDNLPVGEHTLTADMPIYVVDYPICWGMFSFRLQIVADAADLPSTPAPATVVGVIRAK